MIALLIQWRRSDHRTATRLDRAADRDDDADLAADNAMVGSKNRSSGNAGETPLTCETEFQQKK